MQVEIRENIYVCALYLPDYQLHRVGHLRHDILCVPYARQSRVAEERSNTIYVTTAIC